MATLRGYTQKLFSGKKPNSLYLLANAQYLCEVFYFPKYLRTRSRMCCYWDLVPHSNSASKDWVPGEGGRCPASSHHSNNYLKLIFSTLFLYWRVLESQFKSHFKLFLPRLKKKSRCYCLMEVLCYEWICKTSISKCQKSMSKITFKKLGGRCVIVLNEYLCFSVLKFVSLLSRV